MKKQIFALIACSGLLWAGPRAASAAPPTQKEVDDLERRVQQQDQVIDRLENRLDELEAEKAPAPGEPVERDPGAAPAPAEEAEAVMFPETRKSPVANRGTFEDRQEAAARPGDFVLDPQFRGFIPIPRTVFMVKFNPKPRVDFNFTTRNPEDARYRFITARLPLEGSPQYDSGAQFDATANGSQIRVDLRAPSVEGNFRIYYQNDFFGSNSSHMNYRLQHFYAQYMNFLGGFTYSFFEDPDSWPDTVDYEGPNALIFARRPLVHYTLEFADNWNMTLGVEDPNTQIDLTGDVGAQERQRAPDTGFNIRWEPGELGHLQFSTILRDLAVRNGLVGHEDAFGWGLNLSGSVNINDNNSAQFLGVVGEGIGGLGNDSGFDNTDAAITPGGDLEALLYGSGMVAFTHKWTQRWRSTGTFGYVWVDNTNTQLPSAYHMTMYGSANVMYQIFKRLTVGVEGLYGYHEAANGDDSNDVYRITLGLVYSPFD